MSDEASKKISYNNTGTTLVELLISIVILAFVIGIFLSVFQYSNRTNIDTHELVDGTYVVQTWMEKLYAISESSSVTDISTLKDQVNSDGSFSVTVSGSDYIFKKETDGFYIMITISTDTYASLSSDLYKVVVRAYHDSAYSELAAIMEGIINLD